jgi:hypothetical protein
VEASVASDAQVTPLEASQNFGQPPGYPAETRHEDMARAPEQEFRQPESREPEFRAPEPREPEFREPEFREPEFRSPEPRAEPIETRAEPPRDTWSPPPGEPSRHDEPREPAEPADESPAAGPDDRPRN